MTVKILFQNGSHLLRELLIPTIFLLIFQEKLFNKTEFLRLLRKMLSKSALKCLLRLQKTKKITKNSTSNSPKTWNLVSTKILLTEKNLPIYLDSILQRVVRIKFHSKITFQEWKKDKRKSFISLVKADKLLLNLHSLSLLKRKDLKFFISLIQLMSTWSNKWRIMKRRNLNL